MLAEEETPEETPEEDDEGEALPPPPPPSYAEVAEVFKAFDTVRNALHASGAGEHVHQHVNAVETFLATNPRRTLVVTWLNKLKTNFVPFVSNSAPPCCVEPSPLAKANLIVLQVHVWIGFVDAWTHTFKYVHVYMAMPALPIEFPKHYRIFQIISNRFFKSEPNCINTFTRVGSHTGL